MMVPSLWNYTIIFLIIVLVLLYMYATRKFNYWKKRNTFYISPIPFFGNLLPALRMKQTFAEWLGDVSRKVNKDYFGMFIFDQPVLILQSPKLIKAVLQKDFNNFQDRSVSHPENDSILSNLMFLIENPKWKRTRAAISPIFTSGKLKLMFPLVLNETKSLTDYISKLANIPNIESKEICAKYSTNVIAKCAFAVDARSFEDMDAEFRNLGRRMFEFRYSTVFRQFGAWFTPNIVNIFKIGFFDPGTIKRLSEIFIEVLHKRKASPYSKRNDLVDFLLEASRSNKDSDFTETAMLGQAVQFFAAGFETISSTLSFSLYESCIHPDIQNRLRTEIVDNIQKHNGITYEGVFEMKYLDMCVSETLRKYPVLPFLDRMCKSDFKIEDSDLIIEKGIPVYIPMFSLHYDPKHFPDPDRYDPERFADKTKINSEGLSYIPFGEGPRICIGNRFGLMVVKLGLVTILSKFLVEVSDKTPVPLKFAAKSLLLQSTVGVPLKFVPL